MNDPLKVSPSPLTAISTTGPADMQETTDSDQEGVAQAVENTKSKAGLEPKAKSRLDSAAEEALSVADIFVGGAIRLVAVATVVPIVVLACYALWNRSKVDSSTAEAQPAARTPQGEPDPSETDEGLSGPQDATDLEPGDTGQAYAGLRVSDMPGEASEGAGLPESSATDLAPTYGGPEDLGIDPHAKPEGQQDKDASQAMKNAPAQDESVSAQLRRQDRHVEALHPGTIPRSVSSGES